MIELVGVNESSEINDGKLFFELRDEVVVGAKSEEVEDNVFLIDEVEVVIVAEIEVDGDEIVEKDEVVEKVVGEELVEENVISKFVCGKQRNIIDHPNKNKSQKLFTTESRKSTGLNTSAKY